MKKIFLVLFLVACGGSDEKSLGKGGLKVFWIQGGRQCDEAGIKDVAIVLLKDGQNVLPGDIVEPCEKGSQGVEIGDIVEGTYSIQLEGMTADKKRFYEGRRDNIVITKDETYVVRPAINLEIKKSNVIVNWDFEHGTGYCAGNQVTDVDVFVFDGLGSLFFSDNAPCVLDPKVYSAGGLVVGELRGLQTITVRVLGRSIDGTYTHVGQEREDLVPGEQKRITVFLNKCGEGLDCY
jgi:hypothetical protein